jgi:hypothetical protein
MLLWLLILILGLKTEAVFSLEILVSAYKSSRRYNTEKQHIHRRMNLTSHVLEFGLFVYVTDTFWTSLCKRFVNWMCILHG